jgi:hypothetical protein
VRRKRANRRELLVAGGAFEVLRALVLDEDGLVVKLAVALLAKGLDRRFLLLQARQEREVQKRGLSRWVYAR